MIKGEARMTVFDATANARTFNYRAGNVGYVPKTLAHYIENTGTEPMRWNLARFIGSSMHRAGRISADSVGGTRQIASEAQRKLHRHNSFRSSRLINRNPGSWSSLSASFAGSEWKKKPSYWRAPWSDALRSAARSWVLLIPTELCPRECSLRGYVVTNGDCNVPSGRKTRAQLTDDLGGRELIRSLFEERAG